MYAIAEFISIIVKFIKMCFCRPYRQYTIEGNPKKKSSKVKKESERVKDGRKVNCYAIRNGDIRYPVDVSQISLKGVLNVLFCATYYVVFCEFCQHVPPAQL